MALTIQERVGVAIRHFRILRGFTTKQVAVAMGWDPETRTHVSRILAKMVRQGLIHLDGPRIRILDHQGLEELAEAQRRL